MKGGFLNLSLLFLMVLLLVSCRRHPREVVRSCYYWGSDMSTVSTDFLRKHKIHKVYAKALDIDWKDVYGAYPAVSNNLAELNRHFNRYDSLDVTIVPVVFITNATFEHIADKDIPLLALRIVRRCMPGYDSIDRSYEKRHFYYYDLASKQEMPVPAEIQFDCDWTLTTSSRYFHFLKVFGSLLATHHVRLSATIRLHQYKYLSKTGVPPVDRGMLMMYNVNDLRQYTAENSIYNTQKANAYLTHSNYPLPLDIVLPAYSWALVFREGRFMQIEYGLREQELGSSAFLAPAGKSFFRVTEDTVFHDLFLRKGDEIKLEKIGDDELRDAARLARKAVHSDTVSVGLFELSTPALNQYRDETVEEVYTSFR